MRENYSYARLLRVDDFQAAPLNQYDEIFFFFWSKFRKYWPNESGKYTDWSPSERGSPQAHNSTVQMIELVKGSRTAKKENEGGKNERKKLAEPHLLAM